MNKVKEEESQLDLGGQGLLEGLPKDHVIRTLVAEHQRIVGILRKISLLRFAILENKLYEECREQLREIGELSQALIDVDSHHLREELVLFPEMEYHGYSGTVELMQEEHHLLRHLKQRLLNLVINKPLRDKFDTFLSDIDQTVDRLISNLVAHIHKENDEFYPGALKCMDDPLHWDEMRQRCDEIGYSGFVD